MFGFGPSRKKRQARYRDYCEAALQTGLSDRIWENRVGRLVLGSADFYKRMMKAGKGEQPKRPNWKQIIALVEQLKGERWKDFRDRYGDWGRDFALTLGREVGGLRLGELRALGGLRSIMSVSASLERFTRKRLDADKSLSQLMSAAKARLWKGGK